MIEAISIVGGGFYYYLNVRLYLKMAPHVQSGSKNFIIRSCADTYSYIDQMVK